MPGQNEFRIFQHLALLRCDFRSIVVWHELWTIFSIFSIHRVLQCCLVVVVVVWALLVHDHVANDIDYSELPTCRQLCGGGKEKVVEGFLLVVDDSSFWA
jgi:hypothetical protein